MYYNNKTHCPKITEKAKLRMQKKTIAEQLEEIKEYLKEEEVPDADDPSITKQHLM